MSVRAYGKSVFNYAAWQPSTVYVIGSFCIPTEGNGLCYECTQAGTSDLGIPPDVPPVEPVWTNIVGSIVQDGTVIWTCREKAEAAGPLSVILSVEDTGGYSLKDIWVRSPSPASGDFIVYGSYDSENWRQIDELSVPHQSGRDNRHKGLQNSYPFIKVSTDLNAINEIEIVAGE
ncbi:hypothetical protein LCGC14_0408550 [marine sediment metagenome]|uniref:Uncharacterized protein n=1 Tax=marine sediment metagenome TaxID=412755 RepID=A0A0F9W3H4_9ZZZZ